MKPSDELFRLIKSMDKNEKGYFRKYSKLHSGKREGNYLKLFDAIVEMGEYREERIREIFKGDKFLNQLSVAKQYLRDLIIKSLRNYYNDSDPDIETLNSLSEIQLLMKKGLYERGLKLIHKEKKQAHKRETFLYSLALLQLEYRILKRKGSYTEILNSASKRLNQERTYQRKHNNICLYNNLQAMLVGKISLGGTKSLRLKRQIDTYLKHPLLRNESEALSFGAKLSRYELLSICYLKTGNLPKALKTSLAKVKLFRANETRIKEDPYSYFISLTQLLNNYQTNKLYKECYDCIAEIKSLWSDKTLPLGKSNRLEILYYVYGKTLALSIQAGKFERGLEAAKELAVIARNNPVRTDLQLTTMLFTAWCEFGAGKLPDALKRINRLINGNFVNVNANIILGAYTMNIILHYDLGNYALIRRLLKLTENFLTANKLSTPGWDQYQRDFNEIVEAKKAGKRKELQNCFRRLLYTINDYEFLDRELLNWWLKGKLMPA